MTYEQQEDALVRVLYVAATLTPQQPILNGFGRGSTTKRLRHPLRWRRRSESDERLID